MIKTVFYFVLIGFLITSCAGERETNEEQSKNTNTSIDTVDETPQTPKLISPENNATVFEEKPLFEWTDVSVGRRYTVEIHQNEDMEAPAWSDNPKENTWRIEEKFSGLDDGKTYYWRVKNGASDWSEVYSFTVELKD